MSIEDQNWMSEEEIQWFRLLKAEADKEGIQCADLFTLASHAICGKGDMPKTMAKLRKWHKTEEQWDLRNITTEQATAWVKEKTGNLYLVVGPNKNGLSGYGLKYKHMDPKVCPTEHDWKMLMAGIVSNVYAFTPTLADVRRGTVSIADMEGAGWKNFSIQMERRMVGMVQDCLPFKMKQIYMLNPPFI